MQTSIGRSACDFFFNDTATTEIYTLSLHDPLPISCGQIVYIQRKRSVSFYTFNKGVVHKRSEEHTFELQSLAYLVCRLLLEKKYVIANDSGAHILHADEHRILTAPGTC